MSIERVRELIAAHAHKEDIGVPGARINKVMNSTERTLSIASPIVAFSFQGSKRVALGDQVHVQAPGTYMTVAVDLPITGSYLVASRSTPYLGFGMELKSAAIAELLVGPAAGLQRAKAAPPAGISINTATPQMIDAIARLLSLIESPSDAPVLAPLIERELLWRVLTGPAGPAIRQIGLQDSSLTHIGRAVTHLRSNAFEPIQVAELASLTGMSQSAFHKEFRAVTAMSPIQYQKRIRLQEARLRLFHHPAEIAAIAHSVGYGSASQFSREYRREFGVPPGVDAQRLRLEEQSA